VTEHRSRPPSQAAVDATATAYAADASIDVVIRLREELEARGLPADDDRVESLAQGIRSGHHQTVDPQEDQS
jgi:hypothetical protein